MRGQVGFSAGHVDIDAFKIKLIHGEGHGNPLQYSCLENPTDRGAWHAIVHGVAKSQTQHIHKKIFECLKHFEVLWEIDIDNSV